MSNVGGQRDQATELARLYGLDELKALTAEAKRHGLPVHMDGARLPMRWCTSLFAGRGNWKAGVDVLSFAPREWCLGAEAVVFFDRARGGFERRRKRAGHLWSKLRYLSCQLLAT